MKTQHFAIHTYDGGGSLARRVADFAEDAYSRVNKRLGWSPKGRVDVVLVDDVDAANGFAAVIPYNAIQLFAHPPDADGSLGNYVDWMRLLVLHEYAHVSHLNATGGLPSLLNTVLGKAFKPNQSLPRWFTEGIATWIESKETGAGRIGFSRFEMFLRTHLRAGKMLSLGQLSGAPLQPPGSTNWYLYGAYLVHEMVARYGEKSLRKFIRLFGRRIIPAGINIAVRHATGSGLDTIYNHFMQGVKTRSQAVTARVDKEGVTQAKQWTRKGLSNRWVRFSPDGKRVAYVRATGHSASHLVVASADNLERFEKVMKCDGGCGRFAFSRNGERIFVSTSRYARQVNLYRDLVSLPSRGFTSTRALKRLTRAKRFSRPVLQGNGALIWGVTTRWGKTFAVAVDPKDGREKARWAAPGWSRINSLAPDPTGRRIYLSMHHEGAHDLFSLDRSNGRLTRLTEGASVEMNIRLSPDRRWLLYASDATGVSNIYARELTTGRTVRLTNVYTGAFEPVLSPDGKRLFYDGWTVDGFQIFSVPFEPEKGRLVTALDPKPRPKLPAVARISQTKHSYSAWETLKPRSWIPLFAGDFVSQATLSLSVSGIDATNRFGWYLSSSYDAIMSDFTLEGAVLYSGNWPDLSLTLGRTYRDVASFAGDRVQIHREGILYASGDFSLELPSVDIPVTINTGYRVDYVSRKSDEAVSQTPDQYAPSIPYEGLSTRMHLSVALSNVEKFHWSISPARGFSARLGMTLRDPRIGSHATVFGLDYHVAGYVGLPWADDHVLSLRLAGGWRGGDREEIDLFTLGGIPPQNILGDLIAGVNPPGSWLRGYLPGAFTGTAYHLFTTEYRLPIARGRTGMDVVPFFIKDLQAAVFSDTGFAYSKPLTLDALPALKVSMGAELRLGVELLYSMSLNVRVGYARGFGPEGIDHFYVFIGPSP